MFKKIVLILAITLAVPKAFALDTSTLNVDFYNRFNDPYLIQYVNEAIENNHSAKQATSRVEQYRQNVKTSLSKELPTFGVSASYLGINVPKYNEYISFDKNAFALPFTASYEADLLLKNRDKTKSIKKVYEMSMQDEIAAYLALLSDVATVYTNILEYDKLINNQEKLVANYSEILKSDEKKFQRGTISTTDLNGSKNSLKTSETDLENLIKQREVLIMQLLVLTGKSPNETEILERGTLDSFEYQGEIPSEVESDVIFSRPDVKSAELELQKAKIDIRVARKDFLPTFNITGIWTFSTLAPGTFFSWDSSLAALLAGASQDIFTGGRKIANLKFQKAKYEELFEKYRQTDLEAVQEVNTSLCFIKHDKNVEQNSKEKLLYEEKNLKDADKKLARGVISKNEHLNSQNLYVNRDMELTKAKTQRLVNYYTLYKAVGGKL